MPEPLTTPPGAEFAPVVRLPVGAVFDPGQRLDNHTCLMSADEHGAFMGRRLSCTDPDDQRAIWRRAAMVLGLSADEALCAVLARSRGMLRTSDGRALWSLRDLDGKPIASVWVQEDTVESATAALCTRVWGPR